MATGVDSERGAEALSRAVDTSQFGDEDESDENTVERPICRCKSTCQRRGKCPCKTANLPCCEQCKCGAGPQKPCKNKLVQGPPGGRPSPLASAEAQVQQLQAFVQELPMDDMRRLCCRLLGTRGGISLAQSLLEPPPGPEQPGNGPNWCVCGNCREMDTPRENVCCRRRMCVTTFDNFHLLCTEHAVLTVAIHNRADIYADPIDYSPGSYRKAAYRQYILWVYGYLGQENRRIIPSCVIWSIRNWYPSPNGVYMGFKEY